MYYVEVSAFTTQRFSVSAMGPSCEVFIACSAITSATEEKLNVHSAKVNCYIISCLQELRHTEASLSLRWEYNNSFSWSLYRGEVPCFLSVTILILSRTRKSKCLLQNWCILINIGKNRKYEISLKIRPVDVAMSHAVGRTNRQYEVKSHFLKLLSGFNCGLIL